jgi:hypothetical protein
MRVWQGIGSLCSCIVAKADTKQPPAVRITAQCSGTPALLPLALLLHTTALEYGPAASHPNLYYLLHGGVLVAKPQDEVVHLC